MSPTNPPSRLRRQANRRRRSSVKFGGATFLCTREVFLQRNTGNEIARGLGRLADSRFRRILEEGRGEPKYSDARGWAGNGRAAIALRSARRSIDPTFRCEVESLTDRTQGRSRHLSPRDGDDSSRRSGCADRLCFVECGDRLSYLDGF